MTTVPGSISGTSTFSTQAAKAAQSMAPLIAQGAIMASALSPAMKVWVPHQPNGGAHDQAVTSYAGIWVTRRDQAARFSVSFAATPSVNVTPSTTFGN